MDDGDDEDIPNSRLYDYLTEVWSNLEDHHTGQEEHVLELKAEVEKIRDMVKQFGKRFNDLEFAIYRLANPGKKRPVQHDGDLVGFPGDDF
jgi:hypothetical protein